MAQAKPRLRAIVTVVQENTIRPAISQSNGKKIVTAPNAYLTRFGVQQNKTR